jgi:hypothetical protein
LIDTFRNDSKGSVRLYVMMALETAKLPESVPFLSEVLQSGDPNFTPYVKRALQAINTKGARTALWNAGHYKVV